MFQEALDSIKPGLSRLFMTDATWDTIAPNLGWVGRDAEQCACNYSRMVHALLKGRHPEAELLHKAFTTAWESPPTMDMIRLQSRKTTAETNQMVFEYCRKRLSLANLHFKLGCKK